MELNRTLNMNQTELRAYLERLIGSLEHGNQELLRFRLESILYLFFLSASTSI